MPIRQRASINGVEVLELTTNMLFVGPQVASPELKFHSAEIIVPNMSAWLSHKPFDRQLDRSDGNWISSANHTTSTHFDGFVPDPSGGFRLELSNIGTTGADEDRYELINTEMISIRPRAKKDAEYYIAKSFQLMQFFSLFSKQPFEVGSMVLREKKSRSRKSELTDPHFAVIWNRKRAFTNASHSRKEILFSQSDVSTRIRLMLRRFFSTNVGLSTAITLFHAVKLNPLTSDLKLLLLVQAYEAAFSEKSSGKIVSKTKYRRIKKSMLEAIPSEDLKSSPELEEAMRRSLGHANSRTLREKMTLQISEMDDPVVQSVFLSDPADAIRSIVDTRNYITHRSESSRTRYVELGPKLTNMTESLTWLLWYLILTDLGVAKRQLSRKINEGREFKEENRDRIRIVDR